MEDKLNRSLVSEFVGQGDNPEKEVETGKVDILGVDPECSKQESVTLLKED